MRRGLSSRTHEPIGAGGFSGVGTAVGVGRSALQKTSGGPAPDAGGIAEAARPPAIGARGAGADSGDGQRHSGSAHSPHAQGQRSQELAATAVRHRRGAPRGGGTHVQGLGQPQRARLAGDRPTAQGKGAAGATNTTRHLESDRERQLRTLQRGRLRDRLGRNQH